MRLEQFPRMYDQVRKTIVPEKVPKIHAETAVKQNKGVLSILDNLVIPQLVELKRKDRNRLKKAIELAREENGKHQQWLEEVVLPKASGEFRIGPELYEKKLAFTLQTPLTNEQILIRRNLNWPKPAMKCMRSQRVYIRIFIPLLNSP